MASQEYEIEIKSLLGTSEAAEQLRNGLKKLDPSCKCISTHAQLNHYFEGGDPTALAERLAKYLNAEQAERMHTIAKEGKKISVRTREADDDVRIVMKASVGDDSSSNGVVRMEVDASVPGYTLNQLDAEVLAAGYQYQAKWSRVREEYKVNDVAVCLDKNAGYGYLAEFEKVVDDASKSDEVRAELERMMNQLGVTELAQDRLERMFSFYNAHWPEYYGTDNIFVID